MLGSGFLAHPGNAELRERLRDGELSVEDYHRQVLRLVYRLVFLLVAEDRDLLHPPATSDQARQHYARYYSLGRIRDHARRHRGTRHGDLLESLAPVFVALGADGIAADRRPRPRVVPLVTRRLPRPRRRSPFQQRPPRGRRHLAYTEQDRALQRVDFANLGPEELGSVYESLLELHPRIEIDAARFELLPLPATNESRPGATTRRPASSPRFSTRHSTHCSTRPRRSRSRGRHLVHQGPRPGVWLGPLPDRRGADGSRPPRLSGNRRAEPDARSDPPRPPRQVVGRCVYGIDLNPMAVELAKVNLWLDAVEPGLPLSFLDHHVVWGNGLIGTNPRLIAEGIPDEAFKAIEGDDKPTAAARKKTNAAERRQRNQGFLPSGTPRSPPPGTWPSHPGDRRRG